MLPRCVLIAVALGALTWTTAKRVQRPIDDPQACPWDIKICVDGTWVYREPERKCAFRDCWSSYVPPPAPTAPSSPVQEFIPSSD